MTYTTLQFAASIRRELDLRKVAYPKIMAKAIKAGATEAEHIDMTTAQRLQYELLDAALRCIENGYSPEGKHQVAIFEELQREMKCRKSYYGFLVFKHKITQETADYEKAVWNALIEHWKEYYLDIAQGGIYPADLHDPRPSAESAKSALQ